MWVVWRTSSNSGPGSQKPRPTTATATTSHRAQFPGALGDARSGLPGAPRFILDMCTRKPAKIVTTPATNRSSHPAAVGGQRRAQDGEFALEQAEGRRAGHRQRRQQEQAARPGQRVDDAADLAEIGRAELLLHVAGAEKQQRLGHAVKEHVQHRAQRAQLAAKAQRRHHDAGVVNARIRQQPPEIPLHEHERRGHQNRGDAETAPAACRGNHGRGISRPARRNA